MAVILKKASRGEYVAEDTAGKIKAARKTPSITFGVIMDDKVLKIEMPWSTIEETSQGGISEWILKHMCEQRDTIN